MPPHLGAALLAIAVISACPILLFYLCLPDDCSLIMAMAIGTLLGDALLHLIPHAMQGGEANLMSWMIIGGILMFLVGERLLQHHHAGHHHQHQHHHDEQEHEQGGDGSHEELLEELGEQNPTESSPEQRSVSRHLAPMVVMSDALHNLIDGMALGVSFQASWELGLSTATAILLHEVPHELGDMAIIRQAGYTPRQTVAFALLSSLSSYLGALLAWWLGGISEFWQRALLAFTAGNFLYLSLADLVPSLQQQGEATWGKYAAILFGLLLMQLLCLLD